jgi:hypothetical protein
MNSMIQKIIQSIIGMIEVAETRQAANSSNLACQTAISNSAQKQTLSHNILVLLILISATFLTVANTAQAETITIRKRY